MKKTVFFHNFNLCLLFYSLVIFLAFPGCENDIQTVNTLTQVNALPDESAEDVEFLYSESSRVLVKIKTPLLNRYIKDNTYVEFPRGVNMEFYDSLSRVDSKLSAKYAIHREKEQIMEAKNDVIVLNKKGEQLNTEHLIWDEKKEKIYSDVYVKITTADEVLFGEGMESDQYFDKWVIKKPKGTIQIKEEL